MGEGNQSQIAVGANDFPRYKLIFELWGASRPFIFRPSRLLIPLFDLSPILCPEILYGATSLDRIRGRHRRIQANGDTETKLVLLVAAKLSFRYGSSAGGRKNSHVSVRANAFASRARIEKSSEPVALRTPIRWAIELTSKSYDSSHLIGFLTCGCLHPAFLTNEFPV